MVGKIYINGAIGTIYNDKGRVVEKGVELVDVISQVKKQPKATSFELRVNSPGGYVDTGNEIYQYLKSLSSPIHSIGSGMVASIATKIFMAGNTRELKPGTDFMIHLPSGGVEGNSRDISEYSKYISSIEKDLVGFYSANTKLSKEEVLPLLEKETYLTHGQAYNLGFINKKPNHVRAVALFRNEKTNTMTKKSNGLWERIAAALKDPVSNKVVYDTANTEIVFPDVADGDVIEAGAKATINGEPADGEYKVPTADNADIFLTYVFVGGELTEIREPEGEDPEDVVDEAEVMDMIDQLQKENESLKAENKTFKEAFNKLKGVESKAPSVDKKKKVTASAESTPKSKLSEAIEKLKNK